MHEKNYLQNNIFIYEYPRKSASYLHSNVQKSLALRNLQSAIGSSLLQFSNTPLRQFFITLSDCFSRVTPSQ